MVSPEADSEAARTVTVAAGLRSRRRPAAPAERICYSLRAFGAGAGPLQPDRRKPARGKNPLLIVP